MVNHRKPKYSDPSKEAERIRNLPPERIRTPASKFGGRGMTEDIPIVTEKIVLMITEQLRHPEYLQRVDAVERIVELAEKGADIDKLIPVLKSATEDYSHYVGDAAKEALRKIETKKAENFKFPRGHMDLRPIVIFQGQNLTLAKAISQSPDTRKKADERIRFISQQHIKDAGFHSKFKIINAFDEILSNPSARANVNDSIKINMSRIFDDLKNDIDAGIRSISEIMLKELKKL